jgi:hypothetical protein
VQAATQALALEDATELAHAYVHAVADGLGVRALSIKGPAADVHGLRAPRVAADADVWIDPRGFARVIARLREAGWHERPSMAGTEGWAEHSVTLIRDGWPCDLDLHDRFPGFLKPADAVFDALSRDRVETRIAERSVPIPSRDATMLITALHSLRSSALIERHAAELDELRRRFGTRLSAAEREGLARLADETGCIDTLDGALAELGVPRGTTAGDDPALREWRIRRASGSTGSYFWLRRLSRMSWRSWPREVAYIVWPDEANLRRMHPEIPAGRRAAVRARFARLGNGMRDAPRAIRARLTAGRDRA